MMVKGKSFPGWMKGKRERTTMGNNQHTAMIRSLTDWCWRWWWWRLRLGTVSSGLSSKEAEQLHPPRGSAGDEDRPHHLVCKCMMGSWGWVVDVRQSHTMTVVATVRWWLLHAGGVTPSSFGIMNRIIEYGSQTFSKYDQVRIKRF